MRQADCLCRLDQTLLKHIGHSVSDTGSGSSAAVVLSIDSVHPRCRVTLACCHAFRRDLINSAQVLRTKSDVQLANILFQILAPLSAWYRDNVLALRQHPCKSKLGRRTSLFCCNLPDAFYQVEILLKVFTLKTWPIPSRFVWRQLVIALDLTVKET